MEKHQLKIATWPLMNLGPRLVQDSIDPGNGGHDHTLPPYEYLKALSRQGRDFQILWIWTFGVGGCLFKHSFYSAALSNA
jgi:hypothetical protein